MQPLNLSEHARNPDYYNRDRDILVALAWNAVKKTLTELGREELFSYIKSIRLTEKSVILTTNKPIVNTELRYIRSSLLNAVNTSIIPYWNIQKNLLKLL